MRKLIREESRILKFESMDITVQELREKLEAGEKFILIDVREPWEHEAFNIGGELIPMGAFHQRLQDLEDHLGEEIVLYCRSGARSGMVRDMMQSRGFANVRNLLGGMIAWQDAFGNK